MSQITTHILDTARGCPAAGVSISLHCESEGESQIIGSGKTNSDGRISDLLAADKVLPAGSYRMHFAVAPYFEQAGDTVFYPWADVVFNVDDSGTHYHIPLLLAPFGYSTYRGS
ncbi:MAG: 5-hydroxyisourate hydrolase [Halioglobus sp.]|jgi:5-hydroxyisourate hydrolase